MVYMGHINLISLRMTWTQDEKGTGFMFSRCLIVSCYGWHLGRQAQMLVVLYMAQAQTLGSTFLSVVNARKRMLVQFELIPFGDKRKRSSPISPHGPSANARATIPLIFTTLGTPEDNHISPSICIEHTTSLPGQRGTSNHLRYISPTRARGSRLIALKAIAHTCQYQIGVLFESLTMLNANTRRVTLRLGISFVPQSNRLQSGTTSIIPDSGSISDHRLPTLRNAAYQRNPYINNRALIQKGCLRR
ncbi:hypothetical protein EV702DRAFT_1046504 [Suillus placidus]|uniref:Uncharacterized protein n=1 Tax=Suillus placidus TaxID=48579 RepID=A0A9P7D1K8_9AGAM|nr:hypothetical protein EV702DRAFT_1046504 [Suillus placidus]